MMTNLFNRIASRALKNGYRSLVTTDTAGGERVESKPGHRKLALTPALSPGRGGIIACLVISTGALGVAGRGFGAESSEENAPVKTAATLQSSAGVTLEAADSSDLDQPVSRKDRSYLGVSTTEVSETLSAQLGLQAGVGLVVTYVAPDSPAAKAGLQKHDVLVQFAEQSLVHPAQLRKLVLVRKDGEAVKLAYYRAGKQETVSVTLGKAKGKLGSLDEELDWRRAERDFAEKTSGDVKADIERAIRESLANLHTDRKGLHEEIHHRMEDV